jgi:hypothetical protein
MAHVGDDLEDLNNDNDLTNVDDGPDDLNDGDVLAYVDDDLKDDDALAHVDDSMDDKLVNNSLYGGAEDETVR